MIGLARGVRAQFIWFPFTPLRERQLCSVNSKAPLLMLSRFCTVRMVSDGAKAHLHEMSPSAPDALIDGVSALVETLFAGLHPDYQKADLRYHNLQHTLLATQCFVDLGRGLAKQGAAPGFGPREFTLGYAATMLHDSGYLKTRDDPQGTGAKYTPTHVQRSCVLAGAMLPGLGCGPDEIEGVQNAIRCTGLTSKIEQIVFRTATQRMTGCMVATAVYLGQMADPDYPDKLPGLYAEFEEANDFNGVPLEQRPFRSVKDLMSKTAGFWNNFALPKLEREYEGVYRCLALADGSNPYLRAVEQNLVAIAALAAG